ncbi:MAG: hypothetical protein P8X50_01465 [Maritimibacter sp.]
MRNLILASVVAAGTLFGATQSAVAFPIQTTINGQVVHFNTDDLNSILLLIQQGINPNAIVSTVAQIDLGALQVEQVASVYASMANMAQHVPGVNANRALAVAKKAGDTYVALAEATARAGGGGLPDQAADAVARARERLQELIDEQIVNQRATATIEDLPVLASPT